MGNGNARRSSITPIEYNNDVQLRRLNDTNHTTQKCPDRQPVFTYISNMYMDLILPVPGPGPHTRQTFL